MLHLKFALENGGEYRAHVEQENAEYYLLKFVLENGGEYRSHREQENVEYNLVGLHLKFVLENGGEHRAHREQENWIRFEAVCAGERWRIQNT